VAAAGVISVNKRRKMRGGNGRNETRRARAMQNHQAFGGLNGIKWKTNAVAAMLWRLKHRACHDVKWLGSSTNQALGMVAA